MSVVIALCSSAVKGIINAIRTYGVLAAARRVLPALAYTGVLVRDGPDEVGDLRVGLEDTLGDTHAVTADLLQLVTAGTGTP